MEKVVTINGKEYTESELWAIRAYIEKWKCEEEAEEIVNHIAEDEADNDPDFANWLLGKRKEHMLERVADMIEQRNFYDYSEVNYDPYEETLRQYYELDKAGALYEYP